MHTECSAQRPAEPVPSRAQHWAVSGHRSTPKLSNLIDESDSFGRVLQALGHIEKTQSTYSNEGPSAAFSNFTMAVAGIGSINPTTLNMKLSPSFGLAPALSAAATLCGRAAYAHNTPCEWVCVGL